jgi:hypothetical protein
MLVGKIKAATSQMPLFRSAVQKTSFWVNSEM